MHIDINTRFIMLIGTPLHQSFAARMQNAAYKAAGLNMRYFYNEADSTHLREILDGLRYTSSFAGAAITRPNKVTIMKYLDELDPLCKKMGSCNTVVKDKDGLLIGHNTDGTGFYESFLTEGGFPAEGKRFFCIGAGGAGRAICATLANEGAKTIYITDIMGESAQSVANDINTNFGNGNINSPTEGANTQSAPDDSSTRSTQEQASQDPSVEDVAVHVAFGDFSCVDICDCVINASGIGMGATLGMTPLPPEHIHPDQFFFDACYNPKKTQFLKNAEKAGCKTLNGLGMSLHQGAKQIKLWTGQDAPLEVMRKELETILSELAATDRLADEPQSTRSALEEMGFDLKNPRPLFNMENGKE